MNSFPRQLCPEQDQSNRVSASVQEDKKRVGDGSVPARLNAKEENGDDRPLPGLRFLESALRRRKPK